VVKAYVSTKRYIFITFYFHLEVMSWTAKWTKPKMREKFKCFVI